MLNFVKSIIPNFVPDDSPGRGDKEFFVAFYNMPEVAKYECMRVHCSSAGHHHHPIHVSILPSSLAHTSSVLFATCALQAART